MDLSKGYCAVLVMLGGQTARNDKKGRVGHTVFCECVMCNMMRAKIV